MEDLGLRRGPAIQVRSRDDVSAWLKIVLSGRWAPPLSHGTLNLVSRSLIFTGGRNGGCILGQIQIQTRLRFHVDRAAARDCQHGREERRGREPSVLETERPWSCRREEGWVRKWPSSNPLDVSARRMADKNHLLAAGKEHGETIAGYLVDRPNSRLKKCLRQAHPE